MSDVMLIGEVLNASGAATSLSLSNENEHLERDYVGSFNEPLDLAPGSHSLFIHGYVADPGSLKITITGSGVSGVSPAVPKSLQGHFYQAFIFSVA